MNRTLVQQVEFILSTIPESRNSDITLTTEIWKRYHQGSMIKTEVGEAVLLRDLFDLPREDNVKRVRAKIQNEERRYLPTDEKIFQERAKLSKEWRAFLGYKIGKNPLDLSDTDYLAYIRGELKPNQQSLI